MPISMRVQCAYLPAVIRPRTKLHYALLVIEGEPGDVDLACRLENTGRNIKAAPVVF